MRTVPARITAMTDADVARCAELEQLLFPGDDPWSAEMFRAELAAGHNHYVTARDADDQLLGYAGLARLGRRSDPENEVHTIAVDPAHQRAGTGRALLQDLLATADAHGGPVFLEVRTDNVAARALYVAHGFSVVGTRRGYYSPSGADAYTMARPAPGEVGA
jgi:ribosomal-protein-alanine N-acetyltransferase